MPFILVAFTGAACSQNSTPQPTPKTETEAWSSDEYDYEIDGFDWGEIDEQDFDGDGKLGWKKVIPVTYGGVKRSVEVEAEYDDTTGDQSLWVYEEDTENLRVYSFWPQEEALWFADADDEKADVILVKNPDGTYTVNDDEAPNVRAALALMKQNPIWESASTWGFMLTYTLCQSCLERGLQRAAPNCGSTNVSRPPAVCDTFKDFCECARCDKAGKTDCAACPM